MSRFLTVTVVALAMIPVLALAQAASTTARQQPTGVQQQLYTTDPIQGSYVQQNKTASGDIGTICSIAKYPLRRGMSGIDVKRLQVFLLTQGTFDADATGFFGSITQRALVQFQLNAGIIARAIDGGVFGPKTFQFVLGKFCRAPIVNTPIDTGSTPTPQCTPPTQPNLSCSGAWTKTFNSGCHVGWTCTASTTPTQTNKPPLISAIVGPTLLKPNESGTWRVDATDPEGEALIYSMVWGDEGPNLYQLLNIAHQGTPYSSAKSFSHAYANSGAYTIVAFVRDAVDNFTTATLAINVVTPYVPPTTSGDSCSLNGVTTPNGTTIPNPSCSGTCSYPYLQCMSGQWIAIPAGGGSGTGSGATTLSACYMNGQGYPAETVPSECQRWYSSAGDATTQTDKAKCEKYINGTPICTSDGWANVSWGQGHLNPRNVTVGCSTQNGIYVPGNMRVLGSRCFVDDPNATNCDSYYICKRDGWWKLDGAGFELGKAAAPWVAPETFY